MIYYENQPRTCCRCGSKDHLANYCKSPRCLNCDKSGHRIDECPEWPLCNVCFSEDHNKSYCPFIIFSANIVPQVSFAEAVQHPAKSRTDEQQKALDLVRAEKQKQEKKKERRKERRVLRKKARRRRRKSAKRKKLPRGKQLPREKSANKRGRRKPTTRSVGAQGVKEIVMRIASATDNGIEIAIVIAATATRPVIMTATATVSVAVIWISEEYLMTVIPMMTEMTDEDDDTVRIGVEVTLRVDTNINAS